MAEDLHISGFTRREKYASLLPQLKALLAGEDDAVANMANTCAALKTAFDFFWVGFYLVKGNALVLGPFQGPVACTRIARGKGVCGSAWQQGKALVVPDVEQFPGHIACSALSKSEVVVPLLNPEGEVWAVLDVDSDRLDDFGPDDVEYLTQIVQFIHL